MGHKLQPGDRVAFLDESGSGVVMQVHDQEALVRMDNGLEFPFPLNKLVRYTVFTEEKIPPVAAPATVFTPAKAPAKAAASSDTAEWEQAKPSIRKVKDKSFTVDPRLIGEGKPVRKKSHNEDAWEIDLHIEELVDDYRHLTNGEIMEIQLHHFRSFMNAAREKRIRRVIVIHGVGTGRLRQELYALLHTHEGLDVFDAPYKEYGQGATEIRMYYGGK